MLLLCCYYCLLGSSFTGKPPCKNGNIIRIANLKFKVITYYYIEEYIIILYTIINYPYPYTYYIVTIDSLMLMQLRYRLTSLRYIHL